MKARKFIKRDRTIAGRSTGDCVCNLKFPATNEQYDIRPLTENPTKAIEIMKKFVNKHLQERRLLLDEASFSIYAEVRASSGGLGRMCLAKWRFGDDLDLVFEKALQVWTTLEIEENWTSVEVDF